MLIKTFDILNKISDRYEKRRKKYKKKFPGNTKKIFVTKTIAISYKSIVMFNKKMQYLIKRLTGF